MYTVRTSLGTFEAMSYAAALVVQQCFGGIIVELS